MNAHSLFRIHVQRKLAGFRSLIRDVGKTVEAGEMPDADAPSTKEYLAALKTDLLSRGSVIEDEFVLRYALTVPGKYRGIEPPMDVLSEGRGGFSKKRLHEAGGQAVRFQELLELTSQLPEVSAMATEAKLRAIDHGAVIIPKNEEWVRLHSNLAQDQCLELSETALSLIRSPVESLRSLAFEILRCLALFRNEGLGEITEELAINQCFRYGEIYRGANQSAAEHLIGLLPVDNKRTLVSLLEAMAWIRTDYVKNFFATLSNSQPTWVGRIVGRLRSIPHAAGWEIDRAGRARDLINLNCYLLLADSSDEAHGDSVPCRIDANKSCPTCGYPLRWLFDFSLISSELWDATFRNAPRKVLCCFHCAVFAPFYATYESNGRAEFLESKCDHLDALDDRPASFRHLDNRKMPSYALSREFILDDATSIGGMPSWLQSPDYPTCIKCRETMCFIAQFDCGGVEDEEGMFYAFGCTDCRVSAVTYQQT